MGYHQCEKDKKKRALHQRTIPEWETRRQTTKQFETIELPSPAEALA